MDYSLWNVLTKGFAEGVQGVTLRDANLVLDVRPAGGKQPAKPTAEQPDIWLRRIELRNINARIITENGDIVLRGFTLLLDDGAPGMLEIGELIVPASGLHLTAVRGKTEVKGRTVILTDLAIAPGVDVPRVAVDLQHWKKGLLPFQIEARFGEASIEATGRVDAQSLDLTLALTQLRDTDIARWATLPEGTSWRIDSAALRVKGPLAKPLSMVGTLEVAASDVHAANLRCERLSGRASFADGVVNLESLDLHLDARNHVGITGSLGLAGRQSFALQWQAEVRNLAPWDGEGVFTSQGKASGVIGDLREQKYGSLIADGTVRATSVVWQDARLDEAALDFSCRDARVEVKALEVRLNERNRLTAKGNARLDALGEFDAEVSAELEQLADFSDWIKQPRITSGRASVAWKGAGDFVRREVTGAGAVNISGVTLEGRAEVFALALETSHAGQNAKITTFKASAGKMRAEASMTLTDTELTIPKLVLFSGETRLVDGNADVPFDTAKPMNAHLHMARMNVEEIFALIGQKPPVLGFVAMDLELRGTLSEPAGGLSVTISEARSEATKGSLEPALVQLNAALESGVLTVKATAQQKPLQTLTAHAEIPFDAEKPGAILDAPLTANLTLPASDLSVLKRFVPAIARISGTVSADVRLSGSLRKPEWQGAIRADAPTMTIVDSEMDIRDVKARATFSGQRLTLDDVSASLSGGRARVGGTVDLASLNDPTLNLYLDVKEALVVRDDTMSLRADGRLTCTGTLARAAVAGRVELVRGRVFKEIEFLPLSLPNQLPSPPPMVRLGSAAPSLPAAFAQWTFNIDVVTRDPIRLLGNVLNGGATADLHISGTGATPMLEGKISQQSARVQLPFSRLALSRGDIIFTREKPFEPQLDLEGESLVSNYQVTVYATGSAAKPTVRFASSPPLSEPEIATLLATGTTTGDAQSAGGVAANRAAFLILSKAYRKVFGKPSSSRMNAEPGRASFNFNPLSTGTSAANVSGTYEIAPHWQAEVRLGERGFRGMLHYLVRFR